MKSVADVLQIISDSGEIENESIGNPGLHRRVVGVAHSDHKVQVELHCDEAYPSQGYARLSLWIKDRWSLLLTRYGSQLVNIQSGRIYRCKSTENVIVAMVGEAAMVLG